MQIYRYRMEEHLTYRESCRDSNTVVALKKRSHTSLSWPCRGPWVMVLPLPSSPASSPYGDQQCRVAEQSQWL